MALSKTRFGGENTCHFGARKPKNRKTGKDFNAEERGSRRENAEKKDGAGRKNGGINNMLCLLTTPSSLCSNPRRALRSICYRKRRGLPAVLSAAALAKAEARRAKAGAAGERVAEEVWGYPRPSSFAIFGLRRTGTVAARKKSRKRAGGVEEQKVKSEKGKVNGGNRTSGGRFLLQKRRGQRKKGEI